MVTKEAKEIVEIVKWKHWQPCLLPDKLDSFWLDIIWGAIGGNSY